MTDNTEIRINASDLRIGNWLYLEGDFREVKQILSTHLLITYPVEGRINHYLIRLGRFEPIPLSEDILLKAGFEKHNPERFEYIKRIDELGNRFRIVLTHPYDRYAAADLNFMDTMEMFHFVDTLHELMNLYYALTKTELQINF